MRNLKALLSSNSDEYSTPGWIFAEIDDEFGFTLDPCADYVESDLGDVDTGKMYKPRKEKENNVEQTKIF